VNLDDLIRKLNAWAKRPPVVRSIRMHPITLQRLQDAMPPSSAKPVGLVEAMLAIALIADDQVAIGWMHEHDGMGHLIRRVPPRRDQHIARN
jgi:hypothetical protein